MKKAGKVLLILVMLAVAMTVSFRAGYRRSNQEHMEDRAKRCGRYISFAIDTITKKGLSLEGASTSVASDIWVAHELCDSPEISAQLSNLWNMVAFEGVEEDVLVAQLKAVLEKYS